MQSRVPLGPGKFHVVVLVNLYINDLPFALENTLSDPFVLPNGAKLNSLLYADHLIISSRSKTGLQNCLDKLSLCCTLWMMIAWDKDQIYFSLL